MPLSPIEVPTTVMDWVLIDGGIVSRDGFPHPSARPTTKRHQTSDSLRLRGRCFKPSRKGHGASRMAEAPKRRRGAGFDAPLCIRIDSICRTELPLPPCTIAGATVQERSV